MVAQAKGIILDANVTLLYVVGSIDHKWISRHKRTSQFQPIDFFTILQIVQLAKKSFAVPHVLAEVSNLGGKQELFREAFRLAFHQSEELHMNSSQGFGSKTFLDLGLTDAVLYEMARQDYLVVTTDHSLYSFITSDGQPCINFAYLKERG